MANVQVVPRTGSWVLSCTLAREREETMKRAAFTVAFVIVTAVMIYLAIPEAIWDRLRGN